MLNQDTLLTVFVWNAYIELIFNSSNLRKPPMVSGVQNVEASSTSRSCSPVIVTKHTLFQRGIPLQEYPLKCRRVLPMYGYRRRLK